MYKDLCVLPEVNLFCFFLYQMLSKRHSFMQYLIDLADDGIVHDIPDLRERVQQLLNLIPSGKELPCLYQYSIPSSPGLFSHSFNPLTPKIAKDQNSRKIPNFIL